MECWRLRAKEFYDEGDWREKKKGKNVVHNVENLHECDCSTYFFLAENQSKSALHARTE